MKYKINSHDELELLFALKEKQIHLQYEIHFSPSGNSVHRSSKYRVPLSGTDLEISSIQRIDAFIEELKFLVEYLNKVPCIDELHLEYALEARCLFHIMKHGRLVDGDLANFANTLLEIFDAYGVNTLTISEGINLRTRIIKNALNKFTDQIYISSFVSASSPPTYIKYNEAPNKLGFLLGI